MIFFHLILTAANIDYTKYRKEYYAIYMSMDLLLIACVLLENMKPN